ncbi:MAG TPA: hypothetical protein VN626_12055, partial [Clostridia bacterium]|nr:hypothetical protein [Clostridia bacterium]
MKKTLVFTLVLLFIVSISCMVLAAPTDSVNQASDIEKEIKTLKERLAKLESQANPKCTPVPAVTFSGDSRIRWIDKHAANGDTTNEQRVRLGMKAKVSDDISFYGRFMLLNNNEMGTTGVDDKVQFIDANFTHKGFLGMNSFTIGRFSQDFLATTYWA